MMSAFLSIEKGRREGDQIVAQFPESRDPKVAVMLFFEKVRPRPRLSLLPGSTLEIVDLAEETPMANTFDRAILIQAPDP